MTDSTEGMRRTLQTVVNAEALVTPKEELEARYGQLWDTTQLQEDYTVHGFLAPFVEVTRKSDGVRGTMLFSHSPRFYHSFKES